MPLLFGVVETVNILLVKHCNKIVGLIKTNAAQCGIYLSMLHKLYSILEKVLCQYWAYEKISKVCAKAMAINKSFKSMIVLKQLSSQLPNSIEI